MRSEDRARKLVVDTITTITTQPPLEPFKIILNDTDTLNSPRIKVECFKIEGVEDLVNSKVLSAIEIPRRLWRDASENILRAGIILELVNYFLNETSEIEAEMRKDISAVRKKFVGQPIVLAKQINQIRFKYEVDLRIIDVQLARKLVGDYEVFGWLTKISYDPQWLIQFFEMLIEEAPNRIKPTARMIPRVAGLRTRIRQIQLLIDGQTEKATALRSECDQKASEILEAYTPSTV